MANIGYIQVVRHCNHFCGFCSNPTTPYVHTFETMKVLVDDLVKRDYFGVILTGGEPSLHPELPSIARYASEQGLHVRMITNGWRLADEDFAREMAEAGLKLVHVSVYSVRPDVEERCAACPARSRRPSPPSRNANKYGIEVNINCVINKLNADHLDENIRYWIDEPPVHPPLRVEQPRPLDGPRRGEPGRVHAAPRRLRGLAAPRDAPPARSRPHLPRREGAALLHDRVRLGEHRDAQDREGRGAHRPLPRRQADGAADGLGAHLREACGACSLRTICGGLFDRGNAYDPAELYPVFVSRDAVVEKIIHDPTRPELRVPHARRLEEGLRRPRGRRRSRRATPARPSEAGGARPQRAPLGPPRCRCNDGPAVGHGDRSGHPPLRGEAALRGRRRPPSSASRWRSSTSPSPRASSKRLQSFTQSAGGSQRSGAAPRARSAARGLGADQPRRLGHVVELVEAAAEDRVRAALADRLLRTRRSRRYSKRFTSSLFTKSMCRSSLSRSPIR